MLDDSLFRKSPRGAYLIDANFPGNLEDAFSELSGGQIFTRPDHDQPFSIYKEDNFFFWKPEAYLYFCFDNIHDELRLGATLPHRQIGLGGQEEYIDEILEVINLGIPKSEFKLIPPYALSGGQQQRLLVALIILRNIQNIVGIDPLIYVDIESKIRLYGLIAKHVKSTRGKLFLYASNHHLYEKNFDGIICLETSLDSGVRLKGHIESIPYKMAANYKRGVHSNFQSLQATNSIQFNNLSHIYPDGRVGVHVEDLKIHSGVTNIICGPNGGGKSSFLRLFVSNYNISNPDAFLFQNKSIKNPFRNLVETGKVSICFQNPNAYITGTTVKSFQKSYSIDTQLIEAFFLSPYLNENTLNLPFWARQVLAFIASISNEAEIVLLDEPLDGIALKLVETPAIEAIGNLSRQGKAVCISTHNPAFARKIAENYIWIANQRIHSHPDSQDGLRAWLSNEQIIRNNE